jgi:hypothetical protein
MKGSSMPADRDDHDETRLGFSANLNSSSLADLVQLQCLSGSTSVARVSSGDDIGYLYFRDGRVVHAMSPSNIGEEAAMEMLSWSFGAFEVCNAGWPEKESLHGTFQGLLLRAAQQRDESSHRNLLRFPRPAGTPAVVDAAAAEPYDLVPDSRRRPTTSSTPPSAGPRVQAVVRLDANGVTLTAKGNGANELADASALSVELARLIGEALALEELVAIEALTTRQRTLVIRERPGGLVAVRAPLEVDLSAVRERYGI